MDLALFAILVTACLVWAAAGWALGQLFPLGGRIRPGDLRSHGGDDE